MSLLVHYLLVYDHAAGKLLHENIFTDTHAALESYAEHEAKYRKADKIEVVLIGAEDLETIKITHAHYFEKVDPAGLGLPPAFADARALAH